MITATYKDRRVEIVDTSEGDWVVVREIGGNPDIYEVSMFELSGVSPIISHYFEQPLYGDVSEGKWCIFSKVMDWPTHGRAKDARDRSYEEAIAGMRALKPLILRAGVDCALVDAYTRLEKIARMMLAQGAPGRPECED